jgi:hypothetical protein
MSLPQYFLSEVNTDFRFANDIKHDHRTEKKLEDQKGNFEEVTSVTVVVFTQLKIIAHPFCFDDNLNR